jgi:hypothetical protein
LSSTPFAERLLWGLAPVQYSQSAVSALCCRATCRTLHTLLRYPSRRLQAH